MASKIEFHNLCARTFTEVYNGDPGSVNSFIRKIESIEILCENDDHRKILIRNIVANVRDKALDIMPMDPKTIKEITDTLRAKIKPEKSQIIEGRMMALKMDKCNSFDDYSRKVEELADFMIRSLVVEGVTREKANEMAIQKSVELCKLNTNSIVIKAVLSACQFETPKEVVAKYIIETQAEMNKHSYQNSNVFQTLDTFKTNYNENETKNNGFSTDNSRQEECQGLMPNEITENYNPQETSQNDYEESRIFQLKTGNYRNDFIKLKTDMSRDVRRFLVDSEADDCFIKYSALMGDIEIDRRDKKYLRGVTPGGFFTYGSVYVKIQLGNFYIWQKFQVMPGCIDIPYDGVIGNNFMRKHQCVINFGEYSFQINSKYGSIEIPIVKVRNQTERYQNRAKNNNLRHPNKNFNENFNSKEKCNTNEQVSRYHKPNNWFNVNQSNKSQKHSKWNGNQKWNFYQNPYRNINNNRKSKYNGVNKPYNQFQKRENCKGENWRNENSNGSSVQYERNVNKNENIQSSQNKNENQHNLKEKPSENRVLNVRINETSKGENILEEKLVNLKLVEEKTNGKENGKNQTEKWIKAEKNNDKHKDAEPNFLAFGEFFENCIESEK